MNYVWFLVKFKQTKDGKKPLKEKWGKHPLPVEPWYLFFIRIKSQFETSYKGIEKHFPENIRTQRRVVHDTKWKATKNTKTTMRAVSTLIKSQKTSHKIKCESNMEKTTKTKCINYSLLLYSRERK